MEEINLSGIVAKIKKDFAGASIASEIEDPKEFISTGNKVVDLMLEGGIAWGYVTEWAGLSQSGKTLMLQMMLADAQKKYGAIGIWLDRENALTTERLIELGVDTTRLIIAKPWDIPTIIDAEKFLVDSITAVREKYPEIHLLIAVDSVSSFGLAQMGEDMGKKAKNLHAFFRRVIPLIDKKCSLQLANQVFFNPGVMYGDNKSTSGGESVKYYASYRVLVDNKKQIIDEAKGGEVVGNWIKIHVTKTRRGPSHRECIIPFSYKEGIPYLGGYIRMLCDRGYLKPKNKTEFSSFKQKTVNDFDGKQFYEGKDEVVLETHPEFDFNEWPEFNKE